MLEGDPKYKILRLMERSSEEALKAAKAEYEWRRREARIAKLILKREKHRHEMGGLQQRGQLFQTKAQEAKSGKRESTDTTEVVAAQQMERARKLMGQAKYLEMKAAGIDKEIEQLKNEIEDFRKQRERHLMRSKQLEGEALQIEQML